MSFKRIAPLLLVTSISGCSWTGESHSDQNINKERSALLILDKNDAKTKLNPYRLTPTFSQYKINNEKTSDGKAIVYFVDDNTKLIRLNEGLYYLSLYCSKNPFVNKKYRTYKGFENFNIEAGKEYIFSCVNPEGSKKYIVEVKEHKIK